MSKLSMDIFRQLQKVKKSLDKLEDEFYELSDQLYSIGVEEEE